MAYTPGPKELATRALREADYARRKLSNDAGRTVEAPKKMAAEKKRVVKKQSAAKKKGRNPGKRS